MADRWADWQTSLSATGLANAGADVAGAAFSFHNAAQAGWEVQWPANITAGSVVIESSTDGSYAGVWAEVFVFTFLVATKAMQQFNGPYPFMRARVTGATGTQTDPVVVKCQAMERM